ncbi:hypothetical protein F4860DRAFT_333784 [Xylaria cubensis]|nr:hypothetical protein F4860DRAFT_333784 [Xylaria cubensis]
MQVYDIWRGKLPHPARINPQLPELLDELSKTIHTRAPADGASWRITEASRVSYFLCMYRDPKPLSELVIESGVIMARGSLFSFIHIEKMDQ